MKSLFLAIFAAILAVLGFHNTLALKSPIAPAATSAAVANSNFSASTTSTTTSSPEQANQSTSTPAAVAASAPQTSTTHQSASPRQVTQQDQSVVTIQPAPVLQTNYATQNQLAAVNQAIGSLQQQLSSATSTWASGGVWNSIAASQRIDNLSGSANAPLTISNATVNNISGLTASDIPALNYFSTTSIIPISHGGTGTSTAPNADELLLSDANGNWEYVSTSSLGITGGGASLTGATGQLAYFSGTNAAVGTSSLFIAPNGNVGTGTSTPGYPLTVNGTIDGALQDTGGQVYNVKAFGAVADGSTDDSAAVEAALKAAYAAGGGVIFFPSGTYLIDSQIVLPNNGASTPEQPSIRITGAGPSHSGEGAAPDGGAILNLHYSGSGADIETLGQGYLEIDHITLENTDPAVSTPFLLATNTTLHVHDVEAYGALSGTSANQDFIILGGTSTTIDGTTNSPFQGYGTVIRDDYMNRMRRFVYGQTYTNGVQIVNNTIWSGSGSNLTDGAAIELAGLAGNTDSGDYITGNLIEMSGYPYGIKLSYAANNTLGPNNFYDPAAGTTLAYYRFESTATYNTVTDGYRSDSYPLVSDASGGANTVLTGHQSQTSTWTQPWEFTNDVTFNNSGTSGAGPIIVDSSGDQLQKRLSAGSVNWNYTPSGGSTENAASLYLPSTTDVRFQLYGTTNNELSSPQGQLRILTQTGQALWLGDNSSQLYILNGTIYSPQSGSNASLKLTNSGSLQWSGTTAVSGGADTGVTRNAPGVLEINNGTAGHLATLVAGNIGVGTTTPYSQLTVWGSDAASSTSAFAVVNSASTTVFSVFDGGNAQLSGTLTQSSDQRLKTNISSLDASSSLALIELLNPVSFNWKDHIYGSNTQLGFIAQQVQKVFPELVSTTSPTTFTPNGTLGLNYIGLISPLVKAVQALVREVAALEHTVAGFAQSFTSQRGSFTNELCVGSTCVTPQQFAAMVAATKQSGTTQTVTVSPGTVSLSTSTPPTIYINGNNPATITVGATYQDLGATATDNQGHELAYKTFLNGALMNPLVIDTSAPATDTISYVATDTWGNTATATREVIIEAAQTTSATTTPDIQSSAATSTPTAATGTSTTTVQPSAVATTSTATSTVH